MRNYSLNVEAAKRAGASGYVSETGSYKGVLTLAKVVNSEKGTEGIEFSFKSNEDQVCDYLTLWTHNKKGEEIYGYSVLCAILTCLGMRGCEAKEFTDEKTHEILLGYPDLTKKSIGLLLQKEPYIKKDGNTGYKFNIFAPFQAHTGLVAAEILEKRQVPLMLTKMVAQLKDKPLKENKADDQYQHAKDGFTDSAFDDEPPF